MQNDPNPEGQTRSKSIDDFKVKSSALEPGKKTLVIAASNPNKTQT